MTIAWGLDRPNPSHRTLFTQAASWPNPIEERLEFFPTMSQPPLSFQPDGPHIEIPRVRPVSAPSPNYQSTQSNSSATLEAISQAVAIPTLNITSRRYTDSFPTPRWTPEAKMTSILHYYPLHPSRHSPQSQPTHRASYIDDNGSGDSSNQYTYGQLGTLPFGGYQAHPVFDDTFGGTNENLSVGNINSFQFHPEGQPRSFSSNNGVNYNINSMLNQPVTSHAQATRLSGYSQPQLGAVQHRGNGKYRNIHADASSVSQYPSSTNQRRKWQVCAAAPSDAPNQPQMGPFQPPKGNGYNAALNSQPSYSQHPTSTNQQHTAPPSSSRSQTTAAITSLPTTARQYIRSTTK
jgi:hypothetical protein